MKNRTVQGTIELPGLDVASGAVCPVALPLDLHALALQVPDGDRGIIDLASIAVSTADGRPLPCQFLPDEAPVLQPRPQIEGITVGALPRVACDAVRTVPVTGTLVFFAAAHCSTYVLCFALARGGFAMQSQYWRNHFVVFDEDGLPSKPSFMRMQGKPYVPRDGLLHIYQQNGLRASYALRDEKRPYIYPLMTRQGDNAVSIGKSGDPSESHRHHLGLWMGCRDVDGVNFWEDWGEGVIRHVAFDAIDNGPMLHRLRERLQWVHGEDILIEETRTLTFYLATDALALLDIDMELTPTRDMTIHRNIFGFVAMRGNASMEPLAGGGYLLNANGGRNEAEVFWQRARWCSLVGDLTPDGRTALAILGHPGNPDFPSPWQARDDGFFGQAFACDGDIPIAAGQPLVVRHRVAVATVQDETAQQTLDAVWAAYAAAHHIAPIVSIQA